MTVSSPLSLIVLLSLGVASFAGCGGSGTKEGNFKVNPVTGSVKLNGTPLPDADVMFQMEGPTPADYFGTAAKTDAQGNFEAYTGTRKGAPAGKYKVVVSKWVGQDGKPVVPSEGMDLEQLKAGGLAKQAVSPEFSDITVTKTEITVEEGKSPPPLNIEAK